MRRGSVTLSSARKSVSIVALISSHRLPMYYRCSKCQKKRQFSSVCRKGEGNTINTSAIIIGHLTKVCESSLQISNLALVPMMIGTVANKGSGATVAGPSHMKRESMCDHRLTYCSMSVDTEYLLWKCTLYYITHNSEMYFVEV